MDKACEFDRAAFGISGLESAWPIVNTLVQQGRISLTDAIERLTTGPVRAWGLGNRIPGLGTLREHALADVALLATGTVTRIDAQSWASKGKNTPFNGHSLSGVVALTISRGRIVWDGRE